MSIASRGLGLYSFLLQWLCHLSFRPSPLNDEDPACSLMQLRCLAVTFFSGAHFTISTFALFFSPSVVHLSCFRCWCCSCNVWVLLLPVRNWADGVDAVCYITGFARLFAKPNAATQECLEGISAGVGKPRCHGISGNVGLVGGDMARREAEGMRE